jgi:hypothetical protein
MFSKKKKCDLCFKKYTGDGWELVYKIEEDSEENVMRICEECAQLLEVIRGKMEEAQDDESI